MRTSNARFPFLFALSLAATLGLSAAGIDSPARAAGGKEASLSIASKGSDQLYDKSKLSAKPGQKVKLTFTNKSPKDAGLQHNWVLVNPGKADEVSQAGMTAGPDKGYIPESKEILAHTKLLNSGEKDTVEFTAPTTLGDYPYLCTFPGHSAMMKGVLQVK